MARRKRIWYPGAIYHVMSRGNRRNSIFKDASDYIDFLEYLVLVKEVYSFKIHALCLMTNHFHMLIDTGDKEIWKIMHRILYLYSSNFNKKHNLSGHLFENRYKAQLIENEPYFLEVSRYIHMNPVKANIVPNPLDYEYSSYGLFVADPGEYNKYKRTKVADMLAELVETGRVLDAFKDNSRQQYRMFVEEKKSHAELEMQIQKDMREDDMWLPR